MLVRSDKNHFVTVVLVRPVPACCCRGRKSGSRRASDHALWVADQSVGAVPGAGAARDCAARVALLDTTDFEDLFAGALQFGSNVRSPYPGETIATIPTPQLKVRAISSGRDVAALLKNGEQWWQLPTVRSIIA